MISGLVLLLLTACKAEPEKKIYTDESLLPNLSPNETNRQIGFDNPSIKAGDFLDKALWNDPDAIKEDGQYIMYFTTSTAENPFKPPILLYRAISNDKLIWQLESTAPILDVSNASIETPSVIKFNNVYHMFYTGVYPYGSSSMFAIGHAISKDGISWKNDTQELLTATGNANDWNANIVGEPGAIVFDNRIYVYFTAVGSASGVTSQSMAYMSSSDGKEYGPPKKFLNYLRDI